MLPQNLWGTNNLMLIKSNRGQTFPRFNSSNEKTKQAPGRKSIVWAIWISKINRSEFRAASGSYCMAAQLFLQLSNRSSSHNRPALRHKPASAASTIKRFESLKLRRTRSLRKADGIFDRLCRGDEDTGKLINRNQFLHRHIVTFWFAQHLTSAFRYRDAYWFHLRENGSPLSKKLCRFSTWQSNIIHTM